MLLKNEQIIAALKTDPEVSTLSYKKLATKYGIGWQNLCRLMKFAGIKKTNAWNTHKADSYSKICDDYKAGMSIESLMAKYSASRMTVYRACKPCIKKREAKAVKQEALSAGLNALAESIGRRAAINYSKLLEEYPTGNKIGYLTISGVPVQKSVGNNATQWFLPVKCVCGKELQVSVCHIRDGKTKSCGCKRTERVAALNRTHGCYGDGLLKRLCTAHNGMLQRCKDKDNPYYGGKGVTVCPEWHNKRTFIVWALEHGYTPGMCLDRIDSSKGYSPDNCRYVDARFNSNNRSSSVLYEMDGISKTIPDWCRQYDRHTPTVYQRVTTYGWTLKRALEEPTRDAEDEDYIYMAYRLNDKVVTLGRSSSFYSRIGALRRLGFNCIARYQCKDTRYLGFLEVLLQDWCDKNGAERGVASKTKGSQHSWETLKLENLKGTGFKFIKTCEDLEASIPGLIAYVKRRCGAISTGHEDASVSLMQRLVSKIAELNVACELRDNACVIPDKHLVFIEQPLTDIEDRNTDARLTTRHAYENYRSVGFNLLTVDSGTLNTPAFTHWLKHKLGMVPTLCYARQCTFGTVKGSDAVRFYDSYHLQGGVGGTHFGLYYGGKLVACISFSKAAPERKKVLQEGCYNLTRLALAGSVPGAASKLFKHAVEALHATSVVTYSDNRYASGSLYETLGFRLDAEIEPDYRVWHKELGFSHKSHWQRRAIQKRLEDLNLDQKYDDSTDTRTEFDMEAVCGCKHAWDAGKKRWLWNCN